MKILTRVVLLIVLLFTINYSPFTDNVFAQGEFETDYKVFYLVDSFGKTDVRQEIVLKNKTANYYADKFELKIGSTKVENVKAQDNVGALETNVKFEDNQTLISVKFNQKVIGAGKTLPWNLSYTSGELAAKSGQIWEISIPRLAKAADIGSYQSTVSVPISLREFLINKKIPFRHKLLWTIEHIKKYTFLVNVVFLITFGFSIVSLVNPYIKQTSYAYSLPNIMSTILTIPLIFFIPATILKLKIVKPMPENWPLWRKTFSLLEGPMVLVNLLTFSFFPFLEAQTRMLFGRKMKDLYHTPKVR